MSKILGHIPFPILPAPPSWYPGHMTKFTRQLPVLLSKTDIVLELRDSRLPLTSINRNLEGALQQWRLERGKVTNAPQSFLASPGMDPFGPICEHVVVFNKRDLVPEWGMEPFKKAFATRFPQQRTFFASWQRPRDLRALNDLLVKIAKRHPDAMELNVLVIGMPNVGKSTLLNALRNIGIKGPTAKALRTSAHPGLTRTLSTRLKLCAEPLIYAFDSPGVMLPFLGRGDKGAERGVKLALIAGIREGLYDVDALASYLLYRYNILDPISPSYLTILPPKSPPTADTEEFLELLATRLGMLQKGGIRDTRRAAVWFIKWWREEGGTLSASAPEDITWPSLPLSSSLPLSAEDALFAPPPPEPITTQRKGWGFDFEWSVGRDEKDVDVQQKMEECIDAYLRQTEEEEMEGADISTTQEKKKVMQGKQEFRKAKWAASKLKMSKKFTPSA